MTKQRFRQLIKAAGLTQGKACADLGIALSTASRWPAERVPPYAALYALVMGRLTEAERNAVRAEMAARKHVNVQVFRGGKISDAAPRQEAAG